MNVEECGAKDERKRRRTSEAQHGMITWDKLGNREDHRQGEKGERKGQERERKRKSTTEDAGRSRDDEAERNRKKTTEHL